MDTYLLQKRCECCHAEIPDTFNNLLCTNCYKQIEEEKTLKTPEIAPKMPQETSSVVTDPHYHENEEVDEIDMVSRMHGRFKGIGLVMPEPQRVLYTAIKNWLRNECVVKNAQYPKFIWKPTVCDVGSGLGVGSNILSQEADYVLGIDKNEENVKFATQLFMREKNNIYWSSQLDFEVVDVTNETREFMKFDFLTCIEVFEHLKEYQKLLEFCKKLMTPKSVLFISTPNRNSEKIGKERPNNPHHVRELTSFEAYNTLKQYFNEVKLCTYDLKDIPKEEYETTNITPIVLVCKM